MTRGQSRPVIPGKYLKKPVQTQSMSLTHGLKMGGASQNPLSIFLFIDMRLPSAKYRFLTPDYKSTCQ